MADQRSCTDCVIASICRVWRSTREAIVSGEWGIEGGAGDDYWESLTKHCAKTFARRCPYFQGGEDGMHKGGDEAEETEQDKIKKHWCESCLHWKAARGCSSMGLRCEDFKTAEE